MPTSYTFARASDQAVIGFFQEIRLKDRLENPTILLGDHLNFPLPTDGQIPPKFSKILENSTYLIHNARYTVDAVMTVHYQRSGASTFVDKLEYNVGAITDQKALETFFECLQRHFDASIPVNLTEGAQGALEQSQAILNRVTDAAASIAEHTAKRQIEIDRRLETLRVENAVTLERLTSELQTGFDIRIAGVDERERVLTERENALDDRQNTHVRREIQRNMAGLPIEIMNDGLLKRSSTPVLSVIFITLIVASAMTIGAILTGLQLTKDTPANQLLFFEITRILLGVGAGAGFWFAIRQAANRYQQVVRWEYQLNSFRLDVERANFLIEGDLEARKLGATGLPEVMLQSFSRGLFTGDKSEQQDDTVGSAMVQLLSRPASLKIGPSGAEATFDKAGLKKSGNELVDRKG